MTQRKFFTHIFHGNGERSQDQVEELHHRLDYAMSIMSGLQQGAEDEWGADKIKDVIKDVIAACGYDPRVQLVPLEYDPKRTQDIE